MKYRPPTPVISNNGKNSKKIKERNKQRATNSSKRDRKYLKEQKKKKYGYKPKVKEER